MFTAFIKIESEAEMTEVKFYETIEDELLRFAVIIAKIKGKFIFCKHKSRDTWEISGGHREKGEDIADTANVNFMKRQALWSLPM